MIDIRLLRFENYLSSVFAVYSDANVYARRVGLTFLPWSKIRERLEICKTCPQFDGYRCSKCGCCTNATALHLNKLAYPTEECPDTPPRWSKIS